MSGAAKPSVQTSVTVAIDAALPHVFDIAASMDPRILIRPYGPPSRNCRRRRPSRPMERNRTKTPLSVIGQIFRKRRIDRLYARSHLRLHGQRFHGNFRGAHARGARRMALHENQRRQKPDRLDLLLHPNRPSGRTGPLVHRQNPMARIFKISALTR